MKLSRKAKFLILILLSLSVIFIYNTTNNHNINYTTIGDGLSYGIDCYGRIDYGYSDYVKDYLLKIKKLKNYSNEYVKDNMMIDTLYTTLLMNEKMSSDNIKVDIKTILRDTDYLTMTIGLNDLLYKLSLTSEFTEKNLNIVINEIKQSFDRLITEIRKVYKRQIYIIGYYSIEKDNEFINLAIKKLNQIYQQNDEVVYIPTYELSENRNIFLPNPSSYYPNYKGYQLISTKIIDKISKKLEK